MGRRAFNFSLVPCRVKTYGRRTVLFGYLSFRRLPRPRPLGRVAELGLVDMALAFALAYIAYLFWLDLL